MKLRRPCQHGRYELHAYLPPDGHPESSIAYRVCPGGVFLPDDTLVIEKVHGEWPEWVRERDIEMNRGFQAMTSGRFSLPVLRVLDDLLDALSVREAE